MNRFKRLVSLSLFICFQIAYGQATSETDLAERFLRSATEDYSLLPASLIYPECWEDMPINQKDFLIDKPAITIFDREDFEYKVVEVPKEERPGMVFCVDPTHKLVIYNRIWNPDVPAMSVDLVETDLGWFIIVPKLDDGFFRKVVSSFEEVIYEYDCAKSTLNDADAVRWKTMLDTKSKGTAIDEVKDSFDVGLDAALILLSYIAANY